MSRSPPTCAVSADGSTVLLNAFNHDHNLYTGQPYPVGYPLGTGDLIANCAWGDDGSTLYLAAEHSVCRVHTATHGCPWPLAK